MSTEATTEPQAAEKPAEEKAAATETPAPKKTKAELQAEQLAEVDAEHAAQHRLVAEGGDVRGRHLDRQGLGLEAFAVADLTRRLGLEPAQFLADP